MSGGVRPSTLVRSRSGIVIAAWIVLALIVIPVFPHFVSPNEFSRLAVAAAVIERHTLEVTETIRMLNTPFEDLAEVDGRLYSNKAPGTALIAAPGYLIARLLTGPPSPRVLRVTLTAMRLFASSLPVVLMAIAFFAVARHLGIGDERTSIVLWILLFATPLFAYGLLLFSHALVAGALFGAWVLLFLTDSTPKRDVLAGSLIGLAVFSEYTAAAPAIVLIVALGATRRPVRLARVIAAGVPFAILLAAYHHVAFGSVLRTPYFYESLPQYREVARSGFFGISLPSIAVLLRLLFDPSRGLIVFSPVLLLSVPALAAARRYLSRAGWWTLVLVPLSILLLYGGYPNWHGGWAVGPRYLVPAIPFLVLPLVFREGGLVETLLAGFSTTAVVLTSIVFPFPPNAFALPWSSLALPLLLEGLIAPNIFHVVTPAVAVAVPFLLLAVAAVAAFRRWQIVIVIVGAGLALGAGASWPQFADPLDVETQRDYIAAVHFERRERLGPDAPASLARRRDRMMRLPPTSWPF